MKQLTLIVAIAAALAAAAVIPLGQGAVGSDSEALRAALTVGGIQTHLEALQEAADTGGGNRDEHSAGFQNTVDYVVETLESYGYTPAIQPFSFDAYVVDAPPLLEQLSPNAKTYQPGTDVVTMEFSGTVERSGELVPTNDIVILASAADPTAFVALTQIGAQVAARASRTLSTAVLRFTQGRLEAATE